MKQGANLAFLKPDFEILNFLAHLAFLKIKKARQNLDIFQSERLDSGKALSELHIHCNLF